MDSVLERGERVMEKKGGTGFEVSVRRLLWR